MLETLWPEFLLIPLCSLALLLQLFLEVLPEDMGQWSEKAQQDRQTYDALKNKVLKSLSVFLFIYVIIVVSLCFLLSALTWTTEGQWCPCVFCYRL